MTMELDFLDSWFEWQMDLGCEQCNDPGRPSMYPSNLPYVGITRIRFFGSQKDRFASQAPPGPPLFSKTNSLPTSRNMASPNTGFGINRRWDEYDSRIKPMRKPSEPPIATPEAELPRSGCSINRILLDHRSHLATIERYQTKPEH